MALSVIFDNFFKLNGGLQLLARWGHVLAGIAWIGLLYFFNFVQTPAFAELSPQARNEAFDKITWRALWWFRWAAMATFLLGLLMFGIYSSDSGDVNYGDPTHAIGASILTGMLFGITMLANVWLVIWPNQKKVIANARNVQAGGEADPAAAAAGRKALLASRMNAIYSFTLLLFMVGAAHFFLPGKFKFAPSGSDRATYWAIAGIIWLVLELNALGVIGGTAQNATNWMYESHKNALIASGVLVVVYYLAFYLVLKA
jgi:uncharacterized membrane protein